MLPEERKVNMTRRSDTVNSFILQQARPNAELVLFSGLEPRMTFQFTNRFNRYVNDFVDR
jgi:hypothetical protein